MKFYFCETCGKRVTEQDVEAGRARNKKLNGVFCTSCATGVMTMEMMPVSDDEARKILNKPQGAATPPAGTPIAPGSSSKQKQRDSTTQIAAVRRPETSRPSAPPKTQSASVAIGIAAGLVIAGIFVLMMVMSKSKPPVTARQEAPAPKEEPAYRPPVSTPPPRQPETIPNNVKSETPETNPLDTQAPEPLPPEEPDDGKEPEGAPKEEDPAGKVLAAIPYTAFQGRAPGVADKAVMFGNRTKFAVLTATFELAEKPAGAVSVWMRCSPKQVVTSYEMTLRVNGQSFPGQIPANAEQRLYKWHEFKLQAGLLRQGTNELQLSNPYTTGANHAILYIDKTVVIGSEVPGTVAQAAKTAATVTLAKLSTDDFTGGIVIKNFWRQGLEGRAIWGARTSQPKMTGTFTLAAAPAGESSLRILSLRHERREPVHFAVELNGKTLFSGADDSTTYVWAPHDFKIPAGTLAVGKNTLVLKNIEDTDIEHTFPWYMINKVEVLGSSATPEEPAAVATPAASAKSMGLFKDFTPASTRAQDALNTGVGGFMLWGTQVLSHQTTATLSLAQAPTGPVQVRVMWIRSNQVPTPTLSVLLNDRQIYSGTGPDKEGEWVETDLPVPAGLCITGDNRLNIRNTTPGSKVNYYINRAELFELPESRAAVTTSPTPTPEKKAEPAFPALLSAAQKAELAFYTGTFEKLRNQQVDEALASAKASKIEEARPLASLLERAAALNAKALAAINLKPPTAPITFKFKGEELTGQLKRVEGAFAWVVSKGLEVRVSLEELPPDLFLGSLGLDEKTPEGRYDLAAFHVANGHLDQALTLVKGLEDAKYAGLQTMLTHYRQLARLSEFEQRLAPIDDLIREAKSTEALQAIAQLRRTSPEVSAEQKDRLAALEARADNAKLSNRIRALFPSAEVLALRDDLYIELKYAFQGATRRDEWTGKLWKLEAEGLRYGTIGKNSELKFKGRFQARTFHVEVVQTPDHDITYFTMGNLWLKVRWAQGGQIHMSYEERYSGPLHVGKPWKEPNSSATYRYIVDRTDTELVFTLDTTEFFRDKLPAQALQDKNFEFMLTPQRANTIKEIILKGYLDRDWVTEALSALPAPAVSPANQDPAADPNMKPGLWSQYCDNTTGEKQVVRLVRAEGDLNRSWGKAAPDPKVAKEFSLLMDGYLRVDRDGEYEFSVTADDALWLNIDEKLVCQDTHRPSNKITLSKGYHQFHVRFVDTCDDASFKVQWKVPASDAFVVVPAELLFHETKQEKQP